MQVLKFGGTSVGSADNIKKVIDIVRKALQKDRAVVVVSALGGTTDALLNAGALASNANEQYKDELQRIEQRHLEAVKQLIPVQQQSGMLSLVKKICNEIDDVCNGVFLLGELSARTKDRIASYGELMSSQIIAGAFNSAGTPALWKDARKLIRTNTNFGNAQVNADISKNLIIEFFNTHQDPLVILPGFIASDENNETTTLGRGGSDYTAAIVAAALNAASLEIWTDVSGMMTADPRWVSGAKVISSISYQEAMELSHFGAKVLYPPTIQPVLGKGIPVVIKNTFAPEDAGTTIAKHAVTNGNAIRGISSVSNIGLISLEGSGMVGVPGFSRRLFESLSLSKINVILITQGSSEHSICVGVETPFIQKAKEVVDTEFEDEIRMEKVQPLVVETDLSIVALVGENMKSHPGISGKMFGALGRNGVNVRAIAQGSSERNISAVVSTKDVRKAINVLHEEFFETTNKQINLFIAGAGNVGSKLMEQLKQQQEWLAKHLRLNLKVIGLANSRKMAIDDSGIDLNHWQEKLAGGETADINNFISIIISKNLRNAIFVDVTASDAVAKVYDKLLQKSVSVVACNKVAASSSYAYYKNLKDLARAFNCVYLFETNVGAALPVIGTLNDLMRSGDRINRIEAVLSGTLNFVFNNYDGSRSFAEVVKQAQDEGYTEPDPRLDLSGTDVMRKIMILARESGEQMEMQDITCNGFLPDSCMNGDVPAFYEEMKKHEAHFKKLYDEAAAKNCKLKFVAQYENGKASVGLQHISPEHDLYHLYGKDNVVLFYTERYPLQPLVVKGAGAGAEVTASGVFADIIRATAQ
ncbi:bifunctional aspartate kinase/homoserine dehydrogenase I [Terrimonas sp.]|uniref:bifunctional aspartate kinase/homoserine dehydrogenase I n=1 Tax=Terrimonas sp. TaxID=1914338 RepID=UPI000D51784D|nr:bifunctional aspartate kinase/homoserine dehydrogenase I [Terrimonas sp.]PVD53765.1 bifunctional aspartate kinase/homoserine dehydrogenase I [Terrimonas sp.]